MKLCRSIEVHNYLRYFCKFFLILSKRILKIFLLDIDEFFDFYDTDGIDAISAIIGNNKQLTSISFEGKFCLFVMLVKQIISKQKQKRLWIEKNNDQRSIAKKSNIIEHIFCW